MDAMAFAEVDAGQWALHGLHQEPGWLPDPERVLRSIIASQLNTSWQRVTRGARFVEDLGADSLDILQVVLEIEEELGLEIPDERGEQFRCLADVLAFIAEDSNHRRGL